MGIKSDCPFWANHLEYTEHIFMQYPFCANHLEYFDHMFMQYPFVNEIWSKIADYYPIPMVPSFLDWDRLRLGYKNVYNKLYHRPLEKILIILVNLDIHE